MKKTIILLLLISLSLSLTGKELSVKKAMLYSALVPGLGEVYTQNYSKGAFFIAAETAIIFSYFRMQSERDWAINSYKQYAFSIVGVSKDMDDAYYQLIQNYMSSEEYNDDIIRDARNYFLIYNTDPEGYEEYLETYLIPEVNSWHWDNINEWSEYTKLRLKKQDYEIYSNFAFAAAILNRIISVIDSAMEVKKFNRSGQYLGKLSVQPDWNKKGMNINYEYRF
ncbi:MAG: hypothetical protein P9M11_11960 [Candidatus Tenebribacter burtonii]|jgi:hypothetical protein|nr:hypothetical protein [Candidatus Tenebribacter burtonii]